MNVPNSISLARLLMVPANVWLILIDEWVYAFIVFMLSAVSDAADGFLAKLLDSETRLGRYLDPLADKCLLVTIFVTLGIEGVLPVWLVILVVSRDLLLIGGIFLIFMLHKNYEPRPLIASKVNTFLQISLAGAVMAQLGYGVDEAATLIDILEILVAGTALVSGAIYLIDWTKRVNELEQCDD